MQTVVARLMVAQRACIHDGEIENELGLLPVTEPRAAGFRPDADTVRLDIARVDCKPDRELDLERCFVGDLAADGELLLISIS